MRRARSPSGIGASGAPRRPAAGPGGSATLTLAALGLSSLLALPLPARADGGTLRVANVPMGAYRINVFTDPTPITPDSIDVSILATFERGRGVALGLEIEVAARLAGGSRPWIRHPATREQATDPRYYSAKFALGGVGEWDVVVRVRGPEGEGEVTFQVDVQEPGPFSNPFLILLAALLPLILVGWWLRSPSRPVPADGGPEGTPAS